MHSTPAQRKYTGSTYTAEPPDMTPWGAEKYNAYKPSNGPRTHSLKETDDPVLKQCLPPGTPRIYLQPFPFQIVQTPKEILMLFEYDHTIRQIFMDGRAHPEDVTPTYMGHSIGKWDGDALVVDTVGFNDKTWLDRDGHPHSDQLHVTERFHRVDRDNMTDRHHHGRSESPRKTMENAAEFSAAAGVGHHGTGLHRQRRLRRFRKVKDFPVTARNQAGSLPSAG